MQTSSKVRKRKVKYTVKAASYILVEIEKGRTLTKICKEDGLPTHRTVHNWVREDINGFALQYKQARETQLNFFIDQMHDIADMPPPVPPEFVLNEKGKEIPLRDGDRKLWVNAENMRRRLKVDAIKFQAGKLAGVMGYNDAKGITVVGDTINILNYAVAPKGDVPEMDSGVVVKEVNFIETTEEVK